MTETFLDVIIVVFAVIGVIELCRGIIKWFSTPKNTDSILILPFEGHIEDIEFTIRNIATDSRWSRGLAYSKVICVDRGMDEETRKICKYVCSDYDFMYFTDHYDFHRTLEKLL